MYDVAIIGGGPAGATLARLIGDRYKVLIIEHRRLADPSEGFSALKCCGGLLARDAQMMLSKLGLGLPKSVLEDPQLFAVKCIDIPQGLERYYQRRHLILTAQKEHTAGPQTQLMKKNEEVTSDVFAGKCFRALRTITQNYGAVCKDRHHRLHGYRQHRHGPGVDENPGDTARDAANQ
jgi:choline dehydrogenase-like flavoprotein